VRLDEVEHPFLDVRPDRPARYRVVARVAVATRRRGLVGQVAHVLDRDHDLHLDLLGAGRGDHRHRPGAAEERGDLRRRPHGGRQPDPLRPPRTTACVGAGAAQRVEPLERQREVGAALGTRHRVDLVHDDRLHAAQRLPGLRGEQQEQRFRGGDEDVGRSRRDLAPLLRRGVPGPHRHLDVRLGQP
jgi:hypothetical protein